MALHCSFALSSSPDPPSSTPLQACVHRKCTGNTEDALSGHRSGEDSVTHSETEGFDDYVVDASATGSWLSDMLSPEPLDKEDPRGLLGGSARPRREKLSQGGSVARKPTEGRSLEGGARLSPTKEGLAARGGSGKEGHTSWADRCVVPVLRWYMLRLGVCRRV